MSAALALNEQTREYYTGAAWQAVTTASEYPYRDDERWLDPRPSFVEYYARTQHRLTRHIPPSGDCMLDVGCGPINSESYAGYSRNFRRRVCVDFSRPALELAKKRLGDHAECICGDFLEIPLPLDKFDCSLLFYSLIHMDGDLQEKAVRKALAVTKPGAPVVITYANEHDLVSRLPGLSGLIKHPSYPGGAPYYHCHPHEWWDRFEDVASVEKFPVRLLRASEHRYLVPDGPDGEALLGLLCQAEEVLSAKLLAWSHYYVVVLRKRIR